MCGVVPPSSRRSRPVLWEKYGSPATLRQGPAPLSVQRRLVWTYGPKRDTAPDMIRNRPFAETDHVPTISLSPIGAARSPCAGIPPNTGGTPDAWSPGAGGRAVFRHRCRYRDPAPSAVRPSRPCTVKAAIGNLAAGRLEIDEVLGDPEVRDHRREMDRRRQADQRAVVVVRRHRHRVRLRHRGDVQHGA